MGIISIRRRWLRSAHATQARIHRICPCHLKTALAARDKNLEERDKKTSRENIESGMKVSEMQDTTRTNRSDDSDVWTGLAAGLIGGLVASWTMNRFQEVWSKVAKGIETSPSNQFRNVIRRTNGLSGLNPCLRSFIPFRLWADSGDGAPRGSQRIVGWWSP